MTTRITIENLNRPVARINATTGGGYSLDRAYGGSKLVCQSASGGERDISHGYRSKGEIHKFLCAFIEGLEADKPSPSLKVTPVIASLLRYSFDPIDWDLSKATDEEFKIIGSQATLDSIRDLAADWRIS